LTFKPATPFSSDDRTKYWRYNCLLSLLKTPKTMKRLPCLACILLLPLFCVAQVNEIRSASSSHGRAGSVSGGSSGDYYASGGSGFIANLMFNVMFGEIIRGQQRRLERRHDVPTMVSLDIIAQAAARPSVYYIVNPRIRANWGLFSTDFRMNYLIAEEIDGTKYLHTNDWQILQVNLVTTRDVNARIGGGFIQEAFGAHNAFAEWTAAFNYQPHATKLGALAEYRGASVRREVSGFAQYKLFDHRYLHGFATAGIVYQRHYAAITTWGLQGGFLLRIY
jgi:hypothetical protein